MTQLKSKSGAAVFAGIVAVAKEAFYIVKKGDKFIATTKAGEEIGEIVGETVTISTKTKHASAGKTVKLASLQGGIDAKSLIGKDPTKLSAEELAVLTAYLQELAAGKVAPAQEEEEVEEKPAKKKKAAPVEEDEEDEEEDEFEDVEGEDDDEEEEEDEEEKVAPPKGVTNYDELRKQGTKKLWALAKPLALDGINSRSKLDELAEALAEYFGFALPGDEEEEDDAEIVNDSVEDVEEGEEEYDEEEDEDEEEEEESDEDEDEEDEDEDESDDEEEDDDEEDDEEEYDDDEEDEEDEDDDIGITPEEVDALKTKPEIQGLMKKHGIKPPTGGKITIGKVKAHIKEQLFGK